MPIDPKVKGSRMVVESKEKYEEKMPEYLENKNTFREDQQQVSKENEKRVNEWVKKWRRKDQLSSEELNRLHCMLQH